MQRIWQALGWLTAIALASFVPAFAFWLGTGADLDPKRWGVVALLALHTMVVFVLPFVMVIGLPVVLLCRRFDWTGPISAAVVGALAGAAGFLVFIPFLSNEREVYRLSANLFESVVRAGICGALGGLAFWATLRFWPKVALKL